MTCSHQWSIIFNNNRHKRYEEFHFTHRIIDISRYGPNDTIIQPDSEKTSRKKHKLTNIIIKLTWFARWWQLHNHRNSFDVQVRSEEISGLGTPPSSLLQTAETAPHYSTPESSPPPSKHNEQLLFLPLTSSSKQRMATMKNTEFSQSQSCFWVPNPDLHLVSSAEP